MDTIFALASGQGRAGVAVVRLSGPHAFAFAERLVGTLPKARRASLRVVRDETGHVIDRGLVFAFAAPNSFTGEDVVEFHLHGSMAVVSAALRVLGSHGARIAEPGEFTRRALENDRMDLLEVEALGDLISAETEAQRRQAMRNFGGRFTAAIEAWRSDLIRAAALIEATIDFADEDVPVDVSPEVDTLLTSVRDGIIGQIDGFHVAERVRLGFEVAIVGAPNVGKSTLLNALAQRDAAITSKHAGTTRDVIEVRMDLAGLPVTLLDTAGLRDTTDEVEAEGIVRAMNRAAAADIRVFIQEPGEELPLVCQDDDIVLAPKGDIRADDVLSISGKTGAGVDKLFAKIESVLSEREAHASLATHERHRVALLDASEKLEKALSEVGQGPCAYDIAAEEIRVAVRALEVLIGRVDVENLLDEIFASFCLGK